ncbi:MAG: CoA-binding protein, partial [Candidatus Altiarchaeota archaeon]
GQKVHSSFSDIEESVDLAVITVPAKDCLAVLKDIVDSKKAKSVLIISAGFGEAESGKELNEQMKKILEGSGVRVIGPNSMGLSVSADDANYYLFFQGPGKLKIPSRGKNNIAFISQSGGEIIDELGQRMQAAGAAAVVSTGNQLDVGPADLLGYFRKRPDIDVLAFYIESFKPGEGEAFTKEAEKAKKAGKTVIVLKAGKTTEAAQATASHTSNVAGDYDNAVAALRQAGVWVVKTPTELEDAIRISSSPASKNVVDRRTAVTSVGGADCIQAVEEKGSLIFTKLSDDDKASLKKIVPPIVDIKIPLDMSGAMKASKMLEVMERLISSEDVDNLVVGLIPSVPGLGIDMDKVGPIGRSLTKVIAAKSIGGVGVSLEDVLGDETVQKHVLEAMQLKPEDSGASELVKGIVRLSEEYKKPIIMSLIGTRMDYPAEYEALEGAGFAVFPDMQRAVSALNKYAENRLG